jgi:hypothetical protein
MLSLAEEVKIASNFVGRVQKSLKIDGEDSYGDDDLEKFRKLINYRHGIYRRNTQVKALMKQRSQASVRGDARSFAETTEKIKEFHNEMIVLCYQINVLFSEVKDMLTYGDGVKSLSIEDDDEDGY